jgi:hypothetical protein
VTRESCKYTYKHGTVCGASRANHDTKDPVILFPITDHTFVQALLEISE